MIRLADGNVGSDRRRIVILEVSQMSTGRLGLEGNSLASRALESGNSPSSTRLDVEDTIVMLDGRSIGIGGSLGSGRREHGEVDATRATDSVGRGREVTLLRQPEDEGTLLASIARGDIEVEDARHSTGNLAVVGGTVGLDGMSAVDGNDQMRELEIAIGVLGA